MVCWDGIFKQIRSVVKTIQLRSLSWIHVVSHSSLGRKKIKYYTKDLHTKNWLNNKYDPELQHTVHSSDMQRFNEKNPPQFGFRLCVGKVFTLRKALTLWLTLWLTMWFNELTYHFSAQLRKLYYFTSIMKPVAIYHFKSFFWFVVYDQMAISRGSRRKVAKKLGQMSFQCYKECYQFAPS